jgi:hypothetical protein
MVRNDAGLDALTRQLPKLAALGVNALIVEVNYSFDFTSHPDLRASAFVTRPAAAQFARAARAAGLRPLPMFNCLGHQSWAKNTVPLLTRHPEFDETPGQFPNNEGIYCRSWCPQHPEVNRVVFALIDELLEAFQADGFHAGMDEVFLIASEHCPRCKGGDPAKLFAKAVNDLHQHLVKERKVELFIWGDRLLDAKALGYSKWEASANGTAGAVDLVPKDLIVCDWHYEKQAAYASIPFLMEKGFRVWPGGWKSVPAVAALCDYAQTQRGPRLLGYLATTWGAVDFARLPEWEPLTTAMKQWSK